MTSDQFLARHGEQWEAFKRDPMYKDLVDTVRTFDPARKMPEVPAKDATEHSSHLLGRIAGFNLALEIIDKLSVPQKTVDPEASWSGDE